MEKIRVLVIDDNENFIRDIKNYFKNNSSISIVYSCIDGEEGKRNINERTKEYDIVLLNILIPKIDGLSILAELEENNYHKKIIVVTSLNKEYVINQINKYSFVDYYLIKPFSFKSLETSILNVYNFDNDNYLNKKMIVSTLHRFGIPSHLKGYQYLNEILCFRNDYFKEKNLCEIYRQVGEKFNTSQCSVERSIRTAIEIGWNRGDYFFIEEVFGHSINFEKTKPSNIELISTISEYIMSII